MKIRIKEHDYEFRQTIRGMFIFEQITQKAFEIKTLLDNYIFLYSVLLACNPDDAPTWDEFIDELDRNPETMSRMTAVIDRGNEVDEVFNTGDEKPDEEGDEKKN